MVCDLARLRAVACSQVQKAYEILRNPESRKKYNEGKLVELEEEAAV